MSDNPSNSRPPVPDHPPAAASPPARPPVESEAKTVVERKAAAEREAPKVVARKVEPLTDVQIVELAQQGKLHPSMEQNTRARDAALERIAAQAEADAEAEANAVEEARKKTHTPPGP